MNSLIFLIGMPGSGKSYWGKVLAEKLQWEFYDLDTLIEEKENKSITELFAQKGEQYFRSLETELLHTFQAKQKCILATGGGTPCFENNMQWMNANGITVWIDEPLEILAERLQKEKSHRPLLSNIPDTQLLSHLQQQYANRSLFYKQAKHHFTENNIDNLVDLISSSC